MSHLRCPECRLTAPASAYYLRGDICPRCLAAMEPCARPRGEPGAAPSLTPLPVAPLRDSPPPPAA